MCSIALILWSFTLVRNTERTSKQPRQRCRIAATVCRRPSARPVRGRPAEAFLSRG